MGIYQLGRRLVAASGVVEAHLGTREDGECVVLSRLASPWSMDGGLPDRFGTMVRAPGQPSALSLVPLLDYGHGGDGFWFVEGTGDGEPLRALMTSKAGTLSLGECVAIAERIAQGLAALHAANLVHGDISASSVFVTSQGRVALLHPGLAVVAGTHPSRGPARSEPHAIAPEQLAQPSSPASDVFRLGLLLLEMLTGKSLFVANDPLHVLTLAQRFQGVLPAQLQGVPDPLRPLLGELLHCDPAARPPAHELPNALEMAVASLDLSTGDHEVARGFRRLLADRPPEKGRHGTELRLMAPRPSSPPPPVSQPRAAPPPPAPAPSPAGVVLGRIGTRRVTHEQLEAVKLEEAAARAGGTARVSPREALVGEHLVASGKLSAAQLSEGQQRSVVLNVPLTDALVLDGVVSEDHVVEALGAVTRTRVVSSKDLERLDGGKAPLHLIPQADAERLVAVPMAEKGRVMVVAVIDPLEEPLLDELKRVSGRTVQAVRAGERALRDAVARLYGGSPDDAEREPVRRPSAQPATRLSELELPGEPAAPPAAARPRAITATGLDEGQTTLVELLLAGFGEAGNDGIALLQLSGDLARRMNGTDADVDKARFVTASVVAFNLRTGRPAWDPPSPGPFEAQLGALAQPVKALAPNLFEPLRPMPHELVALAVLCTFTFAQLGGSACPTPWQPVIGTLRSRRFPAPVLDALAAVLGS